MWTDDFAGDNDMQPLTITCHLMSGFCANDPYTPAIDGILGYALRKTQLDEEQFALDTARYYELPAVEGLPLAVEHYQDDWWYQCSLPIYKDQSVFNRHIHRRFNVVEAETIVPDAKVIQATKGPYKNGRFLLQQHIVDKVFWHVVGDAERIIALLNGHITHLGKRTAAGFGRIRRWDITADGDEQAARFYRPLPVGFANAHEITGNTLQWGIRPPAKVTANQRLCVLPHAR
jgi:CRISPR type IV-associated protein Csf3